MASLGSINAWMDGLQLLLASAPPLQAAFGAASADEAKQRIHRDLVIVDSQHIDQHGDQRPLVELLPFATLKMADYRWQTYAGGQRNYLALSGQVDLEICIAGGKQDDRDCESQEYRSIVGQTLDWMAEHCGDGAFAPFDGIEQVVAPMRIVRDEPTDRGWHWFYCWYAFTFQPEAG